MKVKMGIEIVIKNMVCPRCITAVHQVFTERKLSVLSIELGKVIIPNALDKSQKEDLREQLSALGFELLDDKQVQLINSIKSIIVQEIHYETEVRTINFSTLLSEKLSYDYTYLSRLFSSVEGRTIEKFILLQKIERVKELLTYKEMTLSEISLQMNYSSSAHLSTQFKKVTGLTPSAFKKLRKQDRQFLDEI